MAETGRIVKLGLLGMPPPRMNYSHAAEFSCVWINAMRIHRLFQGTRFCFVFFTLCLRQLKGRWSHQFNKVWFRLVVVKQMTHHGVTMLSLLLHEEQPWWAPLPPAVFGADLPCMRIIQAFYSLVGFCLSRHLALSPQPSASPAPHPGTLPLLGWTRASLSGGLPAAEIQRENERENRKKELCSKPVSSRLDVVPSICRFIFELTYIYYFPFLYYHHTSPWLLT